MPDCEMWRIIERVENINFETFLDVVLEYSLGIFRIADEILVNTNILFIKKIFSRLKRSKFLKRGFSKIITLL